MAELSRRFLLAGAIGAGLANTACTSLGLSAEAAEEAGAFPPGADPYLLGPKEGVALLSRNENPYGPSKSALEMIDYAAKKGAYYASQDSRKLLAKMIAEKNGVDPDQIAITTGSGEALSAIALIYGPKGKIVAPRLFWDTTALYAKNLGMATIERVPLKADMGIDLYGIEARITPTTGLVQLCNPNNPTGMVSDAATFKAAVKRMASRTTVLVDEAYIELSDDPEGNTCVDLIKEDQRFRGQVGAHLRAVGFGGQLALSSGRCLNRHRVLPGIVAAKEVEVIARVRDHLLSSFAKARTIGLWIPQFDTIHVCRPRFCISRSSCFASTVITNK